MASLALPLSLSVSLPSTFPHLTRDRIPISVRSLSLSLPPSSSPPRRPRGCTMYPSHAINALLYFARPIYLNSKIEITSWINEYRAPAKMHSIMAQKLVGRSCPKYMKCPADIIIYCYSYCWCWIIHDYKMSSDRQAVRKRSVADGVLRGTDDATAVCRAGSRWLHSSSLRRGGGATMANR